LTLTEINKIIRSNKIQPLAEVKYESLTTGMEIKMTITLKDLVKAASLVPAMGMMKLGLRFGYGKQLAGVFLKQVGLPEVQAKAFGNYQPEAHDVFVATFVKSGTNWMLQIAQQTAYLGTAEFKHIHDVVPWPDAPMINLIPINDPGPRLKSPTGMRVIKTHNIAECVPYNEKAKYITVIRDPKEAFVSSYYFLGGILGILDHVSVYDWFDLFLKDQPDLARLWAVHTAGFWDWRKRPNVLLMTFNEMKKNPRAAIERVSDLMGVSLSKAQFEEIVRRSSFKYMKAHEPQFAPYQMIFKKPARGVAMVRSGKTGRSGELITMEQQIVIDNFCRTSLKEIGSDFPYDEAFEIAG
jgi:hypothetical protein